MTNRSQKLFRKLLDPEPSKRLDLAETVKFMEDKWLRKGAGKGEGKDGQSQLTLGSFQVSLFSKLLQSQKQHLKLPSDYIVSINLYPQQLFYMTFFILSIESFLLQSVHSNLCEKNSLLYTLLQHGNFYFTF